MYIVVTCETQVQEKTAMDHLGLKKRDGKEKLRHPQPRSLLSLGTMDSGELVLWKQQIERRVLEILGPWPHMLEMLVLKWLKKLPASFRDKIFRFFWVSTKNMWRTCFQPVVRVWLRHITQFFWGLPFSYLQPRWHTYCTMQWKGRPKRVKNPRTPEMAKIVIFQMFKSFLSQIFKSRFC